MQHVQSEMLSSPGQLQMQFAMAYHQMSNAISNSIKSCMLQDWGAYVASTPDRCKRYLRQQGTHNQCAMQRARRIARQEATTMPNPIISSLDVVLDSSGFM
mmetsp:Transcript_38991/g.61733  ORF Transcript_38991/g.61733 Transcript_38991/m.61733 type:complete len:101 (+) Transcript_38991:167-469(+)